VAVGESASSNAVGSRPRQTLAVQPPRVIQIGVRIPF